MGRAHRHTFQILTKRHERLAELAPSLTWHGERLDGRLASRTVASCSAPTICARCDAAVRFISAEPLLGPLEGLDLVGDRLAHRGRRVGAWSPSRQDEWLRDAARPLRG